MNNSNQFLVNFNISQDSFNKTGIKWDDLIEIKNSYINLQAQLEPTAKYLIDKLHSYSKIHSVRYRLKNPDNLIAKIIRKKIENPERIIDKNNYRIEVTDLIGIRILHLFKEDWEIIHKSLLNTWELHETPIAYVREGDTKEYIKKFEDQKCNIQFHPYGYRSVHYLIKCSPTKEEHISEIQVRTIFEEAWSEIDHTVRYPKDTDNFLLAQFSIILNRLTGSADEMGSYIKLLKKELELKEIENKGIIEKKNKIIDELKRKIEKLEITPSQREIFEHNLNDLYKLNIKLPNLDIINNSFINVPNLDLINNSFINIPDLDIFKNSIPKLPDLNFYKNIDIPGLGGINLPNDVKESDKPTEDQNDEHKNEGDKKKKNGNNKKKREDK